MKKKYLFILLMVCSIFTFTGCDNSNNLNGTNKSNNSVICKIDDPQASGEIIAYFDNSDVIEDATITINFTSNSDAKKTYEMNKTFLEMAKQFDSHKEDIPNIDITLNGNTLTIDNYLAFSSIPGNDGENFSGMKKTDFIRKVEAKDWSCK